MQTESQRKAALKYRKEKTRTFTLTLYPSDADIIEWLGRQKEKSKAIKAAIRRTINTRD